MRTLLCHRNGYKIFKWSTGKFEIENADGEIMWSTSYEPYAFSWCDTH